MTCPNQEEVTEETVECGMVGGITYIPHFSPKHNLAFQDLEHHPICSICDVTLVFGTIV
jgi:hypothetical protein